MTRPMRNCRVCGAEFESSKNDYTVNCPKHRGRPDATSGYTPPPVDRYALGQADAKAGRPRRATGMTDYHRGYDSIGKFVGRDERSDG